VNSPYPADLKAAEAKAAEVLTPVERFVASATETNYSLFKKALDESIEMVLSCYNDDWIPEGNAQWLMQRMDHARNFLALAETYFRALSTPLMQAANLHIQHQMHVEATAPREPSAEQRTLRAGARVRFIEPCHLAGQTGTVMEGIDVDGEILVKSDAGEVQYHVPNCLIQE
jgi:hypothetical protein